MDNVKSNDKLGLSCIENYLIRILDEYGFETSFLFYDSYISLENLIDCCANKKMVYEYFTGIKRLQSLAIERNYISYETIQEKNKDIVYEIINEAKENQSILVKSNKNFMEEKFCSNSWRDDHYVYIFKKYKDIYCYNDRNEGEIIINKPDFFDMYNDTFINIFVNKTISDIEKQEYIKNFCEDFHLDLNSTINHELENMTILRDILLIYKITRKRAVRFLNPYFDINIDFDFTSIEKIIFKTEYMRLKKNTNYKYCEEVIFELSNFEKLFKNIMAKGLEKNYA